MTDPLSLEILVFRLGEGRYGLPSAAVRRILRASALTRLPRAPAIIEGVINLHGAILPVLDIRARFGLAPKSVAPSDHFVVAEAGRRTVALRAERVEGLVEISPSDIRSGEELSPAVRYVEGAAALADGVLLIHDLESFLSRAEQEALEAALEEGEAA